MEISRRDALAVATAAPLGLAQAAGAQAISGGARVFHVFAGPDGTSHIARVPTPPGRKALPVMAVTMTTMSPRVEDWHRAPFKTFTINLTGNIRAEMADGSSTPIGPGDLVYLEDLTGRGHVTRMLTGVTCLFLQMPADFDFLAWAKG